MPLRRFGTIAVQRGERVMNWIDSLGDAISYIEDNLTEELTMEDIARTANISSFYFQKSFGLLCGFTVGEYIRKRRLACSGSDVAATSEKIIDIALRYGYDSPDSFTKAFTRFHGSTPSAVRKSGAMIRSFAPLKLKFSLEGGTIMDYKIVEKEAFTILGNARTFSYEKAEEKIPVFWTEHYETGKGEKICGKYGVNIDESMGSDEFEYLIADDCEADADIPEGLCKVTIPKFTWAVFPSKGAMPQALQEVTKKIFSEWLPNCKEYDIAAGYSIEMYTDIRDYAKGNQDENYYSEVWIPVKTK